jgi:hypothetical protein
VTTLAAPQPFVPRDRQGRAIDSLGVVGTDHFAGGGKREPATQADARALRLEAVQARLARLKRSRSAEAVRLRAEARRLVIALLAEDGTP